MIIEHLKDFCLLINKAQPILGIDYGMSKTGVSISGLKNKIALPLTLIKSTCIKVQLEKTLAIISDTNSCGIVIGLPLNLDKTHTNHTKNTLYFSEKLSKLTHLPIFLQDERFTSKEAHAIVNAYDKKHKNKFYGKYDIISSKIILETVLESAKHL